MRITDTEELPNNTLILREEQQELLAEANEALRDKVAWLLAWYRRDTRHSLISRWELGEQICEILRDRDEFGSRTYGSRAYHTIAMFSGEAEGSLRVSAKLAELYTRQEVEAIAAMTMADGVTPLSFSHISAVLTIPERKQREKAIKLCLENSWTSDQLRKYATSLKGGPTTNNPNGRPVGKPRTLNDVIAQQMSFTEDFEKRNVKIWNDPELSVSGQLEKLSPAQYTEELAERVARAALRWEQVYQQAGVRAKELREQADNIRAALDRRYGSGSLLASQTSNEDVEDMDVNETVGETGVGNEVSIY